MSKLHQAFSVFPTYSAIKELSAETEPIKNLVHSIDIIETIRSILLGGSIIFSIFSFILYCLWIYRINCNTKELGALNSKFKPSVAIWSMLVPIYNLIGPFLAVKKTWQANIIPLNQQKRKVPALFYYWWILVILAIICPLLQFTKLPDIVYPHWIINLIQQNIALFVLSILTQITTILVITNVQSAQKKLHTKKTSQNSSNNSPSQYKSSYKDATPRTEVLRTFLTIEIVFIFLTICFIVLLHLFSLNYLESLLAIKLVSFESKYFILMVLAGGFIVSLILSFISYCAWIYRINCNTRKLGVQNLRYKPGVAIWSIFIPIYNLFGPFLAVKETWQANITPLNQKRSNVPVMFYYWWAFIILTIMCRPSGYTETLAQCFVYLILFVLKNIMTIAVISEIQNAQNELHHNNYSKLPNRESPQNSNEENTSFTSN